MSISDIYQQYQNFLRDNQAMPDKADGLECHARIRKPRWQADVQIDCFPSGVLLSRQQARGQLPAFFSEPRHQFLIGVLRQAFVS